MYSFLLLRIATATSDRGSCSLPKPFFTIHPVTVQMWVRLTNISTALRCRCRHGNFIMFPTDIPYYLFIINNQQQYPDRRNRATRKHYGPTHVTWKQWRPYFPHQLQYSESGGRRSQQSESLGSKKALLGCHSGSPTDWTTSFILYIRVRMSLCCLQKRKCEKVVAGIRNFLDSRRTRRYIKYRI